MEFAWAFSNLDEIVQFTPIFKISKETFSAVPLNSDLTGSFPNPDLYNEHTVPTKKKNLM